MGPEQGGTLRLSLAKVEGLQCSYHVAHILAQPHTNRFAYNVEVIKKKSQELSNEFTPEQTSARGKLRLGHRSERHWWV